MKPFRVSKPALKFTLAASMAAGFCQSVDAAPIAIGDYNGHHYEVYQAAGISWADAQAAALALGGHLVTLTTAGEDAFVNNSLLAGINGEYWAGGFQKPGQAAADGWFWVNNEGAFVYTNWNSAAGEPNDYLGVDELNLGLNLFGAGLGWNDEGYVANVQGYVVEYSVPDSGSGAALMALGLSGLLAAHWLRLRRVAVTA